MSSATSVEKPEQPRSKRVVMRRDRAFWEETVTAWRASGHRAAEFAAERGLSVYTLRKWASRLNQACARGDEVTGRQARSHVAQASRFVEIPIRKQEQGVSADAVTVSLEGGLRVALSGRYAERLVGQLLERIAASALR